jgi:hypothetical protein
MNRFESSRFTNQRRYMKPLGPTGAPPNFLRPHTGNLVNLDNERARKSQKLSKTRTNGRRRLPSKATNQKLNSCILLKVCQIYLNKK